MVVVANGASNAQPATFGGYWSVMMAVADEKYYCWKSHAGLRCDVSSETKGLNGDGKVASKSGKSLVWSIARQRELSPVVNPEIDLTRSNNPRRSASA